MPEAWGAVPNAPFLLITSVRGGGSSSSGV